MILAVGLSPAWQQTMVLDDLRLGEVNRAAEVHWCASGKVLNVAIAAHFLKANIKLLSVSGGLTGQALQRNLAEFQIPARWVETRVLTRVCTTVVDRSVDRITELVEPTPPMTSEELSNFAWIFAEEASTAQVVVVSGSLPLGTDPVYYRDLLRKTPGKVILDIRGPELLQALTQKPFLVKPNRQELAFTVGKKISSESDLMNGMRGLHKAGAEWVLVTQGKGAVYLSGNSEAWKFTAPMVPVKNPIGSGDCLAAGIALGLQKLMPLVDSVRLGMAAAVDNVSQLLPARIEWGRVEGLIKNVVVQKL
jgi:tagatose 6-phosphate kinase